MSNLTINVSYDASVNSAPSGFTAAIANAVGYLESQFTDPISINIDVGYGEVGGTPLGAGALGESETFLSTGYGYSQIRNALAADATSSVDASAVASLTSTDPTGGGSFVVATAQAKALGLAGPGGSPDGYVGCSSSAPFDYSTVSRAVAGEYDFVGTALHEITEVMGRISDLGSGDYSVFDLFRYSAAGMHSLVGGQSAYFSVDGGATNLDKFNTNPSGDYGDWAATAGNDAFLAFSSPGVANLFSSADLKVMDVLGYDTVSAPVSPPPPVPGAADHIDAVVQNSTTGQVDYLQFQGATLTQSALFDYGIAGFNIVAHGDFNGDGHQDLVAQNPATGAVDFLFLDANAHLIGTALSNIAVPAIVGGGDFGGTIAGQSGPTLVSQLANGELDMLGFSNTGTLVSTDAIANTTGFGQAAGVGEGAASSQLFSGNGAGATDNVVLQLADGSLDAIGFSGTANNLQASASFLLPGSAGSPSVAAINQEAGGNTNQSLYDSAGQEQVQMISQLPDGHLDALYFGSGYNDPSQYGVMYASDLLNATFPGFHVVDAGAVAHGDLFPIA